MHYQNEPKFNGVYSKNNLVVIPATIKGGACVINLDMFKSIVTHLIALYVNSDNVAYFNIFGIE